MDQSRTTDLPKYLQVSESLIRDIGAGVLADGTRLPPEREMAADLGISVGTLRKALRAPPVPRSFLTPCAQRPRDD